MSEELYACTVILSLFTFGNMLYDCESILGALYAYIILWFEPPRRGPEKLFCSAHWNCWPPSMMAIVPLTYSLTSLAR